MKRIKTDPITILKNAAMDFFGCFLFAVSIQMFIAPNQVAPGGISGLAVVLNFLTGFPIGAWSFIMNVPLLLLALKFLGLNFTLRTLISVALSSLLTDYVAVLIPAYTGNALLACLFGGILMGAGLGLVFMCGSTTGGTEILSKLILLKQPHWQLGRLMFVIDLVIIVFSAIIFGKMETALYGIVTVYIASYVIDSLLYGLEKGKLVYIISKQSDRIADRIMQELDRGCTLLDSMGAFSKQQSHVVMVAVYRQQYYALKKLVREEDPNAFIVITDATEVIGEGFKHIADS